MVYSSSSDEDENQPCYRDGFEAGRSGTYNQTQQSVWATPVIVMHTMRALFQVAYRLGEETILHVIQSRIDS